MSERRPYNQVTVEMLLGRISEQSGKAQFFNAIHICAELQQHLLLGLREAINRGSDLRGGERSAAEAGMVPRDPVEALLAVDCPEHGGGYCAPAFLAPAPEAPQGGPPRCKPGIEKSFGPCTAGSAANACSRVSDPGEPSRIMSCTCPCHPF